MADKVIIFGKSSWPHTNQARSAYGDGATYVDVVSEPDKLKEMLKFSKGVRKVPVIVEGKKVEIGYGGSWGVWLLIGDESQGYILLNPKSQEPNLKLSGVRFQVSGRTDRKAKLEPWNPNTETLALGICNLEF